MQFVNIFAGINYSVALTALHQSNKEMRSGASGGLIFSY